MGARAQHVRALTLALPYEEHCSPSAKVVPILDLLYRLVSFWRLNAKPGRIDRSMRQCGQVCGKYTPTRFIETALFEVPLVKRKTQPEGM